MSDVPRPHDPAAGRFPGGFPSADHPPADHPPADHPPAERLAALADEPATPAEAAHLAACAACRAEVAAYVALVAAARDEGAAAYALDGGRRTHVVTPGGDDAAADADAADAEWAAVAGTLRAEGLIAAGGRGAPHTRGRPAGGAAPGRRPAPRVDAGGGRGWPRVGRVGRVAAGALLAASAGGAGRLSATHGPWAAAGVPGSAAVAASDSAAPEVPATPDAARRALARARQQYLQAAAVLAATDLTSVPPSEVPADGALAAGLPSPATAGARPAAPDGRGAPHPADAPDARGAELLRARLAALDAMLPRVRAAAQAAPQDPAVNHVYLTAYDAREAALRELGQAMPAGARLAGY